MKTIIQTAILSLLLFIFFLLWTFPFNRLGPRVRNELEKVIGREMRIQAQCNVEGFDFAFPLGVKWQKLGCVAPQFTLFDFDSGRLNLFPFFRGITTEVGKGRMKIKIDFAGLIIPAKTSEDILGIHATFDNVPVEKFLPVVMANAPKIHFALPQEIKLQGILQGKVDLPLRDMNRKDGSVDLRFTNLKAPSQMLLENLGLKELNFSKSNIKAELNAGKLQIQDLAFLSKEISGKVEGAVDLSTGDFNKATPNLTLKWQIVKSDALMASYLGQALVAAPCPSPDEQGFCTRRINRMQDFKSSY